MTHNDVYLALLAIACGILVYAATGRRQPATVALVPLGLAIVVLAMFLKAAGAL